MKIHIPKDMGQLKIFPPDTFKAVIADLWVKPAKSSGEPVCTLKWIVKTEHSDEKLRKKKDYESTVGNVVLDMYSLQEQAMWRFNDIYAVLTGEGLPTDEDFTEDEFQEMCKSNLLNLEAFITVTQGETNTGTPRMEVEEVTPV